MLSDLKNATKMVGCCIAFKLTTKLMLTFWVGKAQLIELRFRCPMPATKSKQMWQGTYSTRIASYNKQTRESTNF